MEAQIIDVEEVIRECLAASRKAQGPPKVPVRLHLIQIELSFW